MEYIYIQGSIQVFFCFGGGGGGGGGRGRVVESKKKKFSHMKMVMSQLRNRLLDEIFYKLLLKDQN